VSVSEHPPGHLDHVRREAVTTALYVAVCLLAGLTAIDDDDHPHTLEIVWGTTVGLALAHWFAFRLSARYVAGGTFHAHDAEVALAELVGAGSVAVLATLPVILFPERVELDVARLLVAGFIGLVGFAVARTGGASMVRSIVYGGTTLVVAGVIALVKNILVGH
jgi:hypothetical protein